MATGNICTPGWEYKLLKASRSDLAPRSRPQVELKSGETYRGDLKEAEDNWNCQLANVTATSRDGRVTQIERVYIRGSKIRFFIIPDMLKNAPMFKRIDPKMKGKLPPPGSTTQGRGRRR